MTSMYVPRPVISLALNPADKKSADNMAKALNRFTKEDPTFTTYVDPESNQTIIQGMGELHLEVYVERMKREYKADVATDKPEVAYRESISQRADFNYTHRKQTGGSGQFARIAGYFEPIIDTDEGQDYEFVDQIKGVIQQSLSLLVIKVFNRLSKELNLVFQLLESEPSSTMELSTQLTLLIWRSKQLQSELFATLMRGQNQLFWNLL